MQPETLREPPGFGSLYTHGSGDVRTGVLKWLFLMIRNSVRLWLPTKEDALRVRIEEDLIDQMLGRNFPHDNNADSSDELCAHGEFERTVLKCVTEAYACGSAVEQPVVYMTDRMDLLCFRAVDGLVPYLLRQLLSERLFRNVSMRMVTEMACRSITVREFARIVEQDTLREGGQ